MWDRLGQQDLPETRTATYQVSLVDFEPAQAVVLDLLRRNGERGTESLLTSLVGGQSSFGFLLVDFIRRMPRDVEGNCQSFLNVLSIDGRVGPYRRR